MEGNVETAWPRTTEQPVQDKAAHATGTMRITVTENGPYVVKGGVPLDEAAIVPVAGHREYRTGRTFSDQETYALCRCGRTSTPPFCDGSHLEGFDGTETAGHQP